MLANASPLQDCANLLWLDLVAKVFLAALSWLALIPHPSPHPCACGGRLLLACNGYLHDLVCTALHTGFRRNELLSLRPAAKARFGSLKISKCAPSVWWAI